MSNTFESYSFGKVAIKKLSPISENFRLYSAGWLGEKPSDWTVMRVTGAEFRAAKSGPRKGKMCMLVKGTERTTYVTKEEIQREDALTESKS